MAPLSTSTNRRAPARRMAGPAARDPQQVLRDRAADLARPLASADSLAASGAECVLFGIETQTYAVEARYAREALSVAQLTPLPGLPPSFRGLANVRSQIMPVFDLRGLLQLPVGAVRARETVLLLSCDGADFGLLTDAILGSRMIALDQLRHDVAGLHEQFLQGLTHDGVIVLDVSALTSALVVENRS